MSDSEADKPALPPHTKRFIHDLRNSIASVRAGANILSRPSVSPDMVQEVAAGLHQQVQDMLALINEFLGVDANPAPLPTGAGAGSNQPLNVLIADDNADAANTLAMYLRLDGHHPVVTFDGEQTLRVAAADPPQVMLLDIGMPTQDGYDVAREVRSQPWGTDVRLIAVSGYFSPEDRERALQAGFDDLLSKPIDPHTLQRLLLAAH